MDDISVSVDATVAGMLTSVDSISVGGAAPLPHIEHEQTSTGDNTNTNEAEPGIPAESTSAVTTVVIEDTGDMAMDEISDSGDATIANMSTSNTNEAEPGIPAETVENPEENSAKASDIAANSDIVISSATYLRSITPNIRKKGHPKGSDLTVIGLKKKRLILKRRPVPFHQSS